MRFEKGSEFWEARVEGKKLVRRSGRLDAKGRSATRALPTRIAARHALREAIEEKLAEGFVAVGDEAPEAPVEPHDAELDALLERDPGNPETALVYADWLQARGVARGEVMMIQHAALRAKGAEARRLRDELARVLAVHSEVLLGDLGEVENLFELKWRLGFVSEARIIADRSKRVKTVVAKLWKNPNQSRLLADLVRDFLALRSARFVESLTLESIGGRDFSEVLGHLAAQAPRTLGAITIPTTQYLEASLGVLGTVDMERGGMLRRRLGEYADAGIELGTVPLSLPSLRELVIEPPIAFTDEVPGLALLAESAMPALEVLALDCRRGGRTSTICARSSAPARTRSSASSRSAGRASPRPWPWSSSTRR
jgi:predicted DNA-binding WGR domain protein